MTLTIKGHGPDLLKVTSSKFRGVLCDVKELTVLKFEIELFI